MFRFNRKGAEVALTLLGAIVSSGVLAPSVEAITSDVSAPVYVSSYVTPVAVDVTSGPATIEVSIRLTDDSGVAGVLLSLQHSSSGQSYARSTSLGSGTAQNGVWKGNITIPQGAAAGAWSLRFFNAEDVVGNETAGFTAIRTIQVTSQ